MLAIPGTAGDANTVASGIAASESAMKMAKMVRLRNKSCASEGDCEGHEHYVKTRLRDSQIRMGRLPARPCTWVIEGTRISLSG